MFIDESGVATSTQPLRGRSPRGEHCVASDPAGHWKICSMIGAVRLDGPLLGSPLDGLVDQTSFAVWVIDYLWTSAVLGSRRTMHSSRVLTRGCERSA